MGIQKHQRSSILRFIFLCVLFLLGTPSIANANGIVPVFYFFNSYTSIPSLILLVIIIIAETIVLKLSIKSVKFVKHLWFATLINIVSSFAGMLLVLLGSILLLDLYYGSIIITLGLPFLITLASEYPMISFLYREHLTDKSVWWLDFKINILSYVLFIVLYVPFLFGFAALVAKYMDGKTMKEWSHSEIIENEGGGLYIINDLHKGETYNCELRCYDLTTRQWEPVKKFKGSYLSWNNWDISDSYLAYQANRKTTELLNRIDDVNSMTLPLTCRRLQISPEQKYCALLEYCGDVRIRQKDSSWHRTLGTKCKLHIYDIGTGESGHEGEVCVFDEGLSWSADSKRLLLVLLEDTELVKSEPEVTHFDETYPKFIYMYDIQAGVLEKVCEGTSPEWSKDGSKIAFVRDEQVCVYDFISGQTKSLFSVKGFYGEYCLRCSPSGENLLVVIPSHPQMMYHQYFIGVINIENPELKYIIDKGSFRYGVEWVGERVKSEE